MKLFTEEKIVKTRRRLSPAAVQKLLGMILILLGIVTICIFRNEDASAGVFLVLLGIARTFCKE